MAPPWIGTSRQRAPSLGQFLSDGHGLSWKQRGSCICAEIQALALEADLNGAQPGGVKATVRIYLTGCTLLGMPWGRE